MVGNYRYYFISALNLDIVPRASSCRMEAKMASFNLIMTSTQDPGSKFDSQLNNPNPFSTPHERASRLLGSIVLHLQIIHPAKAGRGTQLVFAPTAPCICLLCVVSISLVCLSLRGAALHMSCLLELETMACNPTSILSARPVARPSIHL